MCRAVALLTIFVGAWGISSQMVIARQAQVTGKWVTLPYTMAINPIHVGLMHTGQVLIVAGSENAIDLTRYVHGTRFQRGRVIVRAPRV